MGNDRACEAKKVTDTCKNHVLTQDDFPEHMITTAVIPEDVVKIEMTALNMCRSVHTVLFNAIQCKTGGSRKMGCLGFYDEGLPEYLDFNAKAPYYEVSESNIEEIIFGEKVEIIPSFLLAYTKVQSVHIPASVTQIQPGAFYNASHLKTITVDDKNPRYKVEDGVLIDKIDHVLLCAPAKLRLPKIYKVPQDVTAIGDYAFADHEYHYGFDIQLHENVTSTGKYTPSHLKLILNSPKAELQMPGGAIRGTTLLQADNGCVPDGVTAIADGAFANWDFRNTRVVLPESVTEIGAKAFTSEGLKELVILAERPHCAPNFLSDSEIEYLTIFLNGEQKCIYLPTALSVPRRRRLLACITCLPEGGFAFDVDAYAKVDQIGRWQMILRDLCLLREFGRERYANDIVRSIRYVSGEEISRCTLKELEDVFAVANPTKKVTESLLEGVKNLPSYYDVRTDLVAFLQDEWNKKYAPQQERTAYAKAKKADAKKVAEKLMQPMDKIALTYKAVGIETTQKRVRACEKLVEGGSITLEREPTNSHDSDAILLKNSKGEQCGYLSADTVKLISPLLDAGVLRIEQATVLSYVPGNKNAPKAKRADLSIEITWRWDTGKYSVYTCKKSEVPYVFEKDADGQYRLCAAYQQSGRLFTEAISTLKETDAAMRYLLHGDGTCDLMQAET